MRFRNKILYISFLLLLSCKNADELSKILLKGDADYLEGSFSEFPMDMYRPAKLYVIGNKLIVFDDVKEELFKVFKIPTLDYRPRGRFLGKRNHVSFSKQFHSRHPGRKSPANRDRRNRRLS